MFRTLHGLVVLAYTVVLMNTARGEDASPPKSTKSVAQVEHLIKQLGSNQFQERDAASKALKAIGEPALEKLRKVAANSGDAEVRRQGHFGLLFSF